MMQQPLPIPEWFTARDLAGTPGIPDTVSGVIRSAANNNWLARKRKGQGGGREYHISSLPAVTQDYLRAASAKPEPTVRVAAEPLERSDIWRRYEVASEHERNVAESRLEAVTLHHALVARGAGRTAAATETAERMGVARGTLYRWLDAVKPYERSSWLAALTPTWNKEPRYAECTPDAWEFFKADYLRLERPTITSCYRRLERAARAHGWSIPSMRTITSWAKERIPPLTLVTRREGQLALMKRYPALQRSVKELTALQWVNGDGYQHNVFVQWPDGSIHRPKTWYWQDVHSRKVLTYRVDLTENTDQIRLSFGDLVAQYGIPEDATIDNTRAAANKTMTGGMATRYRFAAKDDEADGIFKLLGVRVHWTSVNQAGTRAAGHGQAKPIERAFGVGGLGDHVDKHPDFTGAYAGENVMAKPENYRGHAVPLEQFLRTLNECIVTWNAQEGRRTQMAQGVSSYDAVFNASYATAPIRKATEEQQRLCLLPGEALTVAADGTFYLAAGGRIGERRSGRNRYYAPELQALGERREKIVVRYDPDNLHSHVYAYSTDGKYLARADLYEAAGFGDTQVARSHNGARRDFVKAQKKLAAAETAMNAAQVSELLPRPQLPDPVESKVVRPVRAPIQQPPRGTFRKVEPTLSPERLAELQERALASSLMQPDTDAAAPCEDPRANYERWLDLDARIAAGDEASEAERFWHESYQDCSEFRVQQRNHRSEHDTSCQVQSFQMPAFLGYHK